MAQKDPYALYKHYYIDRDFERLDLFEQLADSYNVQSALYAGSFVHITPSFVYPTTVYVDSDKQAEKFFKSDFPLDFIKKNKVYETSPTLRFYGQSYTEKLNEDNESFDLLISQYAGFISLYCKQYLKIGGLLLANNSHGDASMASIDEQFELVAVVNRRKGKHRLKDTELEQYLIPKKDIEITKEYLEKTQRSVGYTKSADMYIFRRVS